MIRKKAIPRRTAGLITCLALFAVAGFTVYRTQAQIELDRKLLAAVGEANVDAARSLLRTGANPNAQHVADESVWDRLLRAFHLRSRLTVAPEPALVTCSRHFASDEIYRRKVELVRLLIDFGADINTRDVHGEGVLHWFSNSYDNDLYDFLLVRGADPNAVDEDGQSPIYDVIASGDQTKLKALVVHGADIHHRDKDGRRPVDMIWSEGRGTPIFVETVAFLLRSGLKVDDKDNEGRTLLMDSSGSGWVDLVRLLLQAGANPNLQDDSKQSAMDHALTQLHYGEDGQPYFSAQRLHEVIAILKDACGKAYFHHDKEHPTGPPIH